MADLDDDQPGTSSRRDLLRRAGIAGLGAAWLTKFGSEMPALGATSTMSEFPAAGKFVILSNPAFAMRAMGKTESLIFDARMVVRTTDPYLGDDGHRRVDVTVDSWEAHGTSVLLGDISARLTPGVTQPLSFARSDARAGEGPDFPATLEFNMRYDFEAVGQVLSAQDGTARGTISNFPPNGEVFEIDGKRHVIYDALGVNPVLEIEPLLCASLTTVARAMNSAGFRVPIPDDAVVAAC